MIYFTVAAIGVASWFYPPSMYDARAHVCAMNVVDSGTRVEIINDDNRRHSWCIIIGTGPFVAGRVIDVSPAVRDDLDMRQSGTANVRVYVAHRKANREAPVVHPVSDPALDWRRVRPCIVLGVRNRGRRAAASPRPTAPAVVGTRRAPVLSRGCGTQHHPVNQFRHR